MRDLDPRSVAPHPHGWSAWLWLAHPSQWLRCASGSDREQVAEALARHRAAHRLSWAHAWILRSWEQPPLRVKSNLMAGGREGQR